VGKGENNIQDTQMVTALTKSWKENTDRMSEKRKWLKIARLQCLVFEGEKQRTDN
jgi:hypothetical protein